MKFLVTAISAVTIGLPLAFVGKALASGEYHGETQQQVILAKADILAELGKFDEAIKVIDEAKAAAPESQLASDLDDCKAEIKQAKDKAAE